MGQMSFFSAEARPARIADLAGMLCGPGQAVGFGRGTAARLSAVLAEPWRAEALAAACAQRGISAEVQRTETGSPLVRTAFRADLTELAASWLRGAVKSVPSGFVPDGSALRIWALTSGRPSAGGYLFGLDPHAPETHGPLAASLARAGLPAKPVGGRPDDPALRIVGKRRLERLAELVGTLPAGPAGFGSPDS